MKLSVVILNYKTAGLTKQCLAGLYKVKLPFDFEVIVVDNASDDSCLKIVKENFSDVICVQAERNDGYAAGNNFGLRLAQGEFILILNPDIIVIPGQIEKLVGFMELNPKVGLAGPRLLNPDGTLQLSAYRFPKVFTPLLRRTFLGKLSKAAWHLGQYQMTDWDHAENRAVDWLLGACLITRREGLKTVGYLDERYKLYVEDTDWAKSFWFKGYEVWYVAEAEFIHFHERLSAQGFLSGVFTKVAWRHVASWMKYFWKWHHLQ